MPTARPEYRIVMALLPLEKVADHEKSLGENCAFVTVKWSDKPLTNQKAVAEGIAALNDAYCPK